ncbi:MAG: hypothetical protein E3J35_04085 [Methanomassiliicoccales archaeon]|nr:MAG: hypothetical protein E3J35_04085 [Methanomassiliicoccales archaeon]
MAFIKQFFKDLRTPLYKNALYLMSNTALASVVTFFFWMIVARYYNPSQVGVAAALIPLMALLGILSRFGFEMGLVRFLPSSGKDSKAMINSCITITTLAAILISLVFLVGMDIWSPALLFIREDWVFLLSFIVFSVAFALSPLVNYIFVARRNTKFVLAGTCITGLKLVFPILLISFLGAFGIFVSWGLALLIALLVGIFAFVPMVNAGYRPFPTVKKNVVKKMLHFSAGNYAAVIFGMMPASLLPLIIMNTINVEQVAFYYIAFTIATLLFAITDAVCLSLFAEGSHFEKELRNIVRKALKLVLVLLIPAVIIVMLFGEYVLLLFGSSYSSEGLVLLRIFALSSIFIAFSGIFLATRRVLKRMKPIVGLPAFSASIIIGFSFMLIPSMGLVGVAVAWILGRGITAVGIGIYVGLGMMRERSGKR